MNPLIREALTRREADVAEELLKGHTNRKIAEALGIGERTVKQYMRQMFMRFQISHPGERCGNRILLAQKLLSQ